MKRRECLPCREREEYEAESVKGGCTTITVRQRSRYVDEFLRFSSENGGNTIPKRITQDDIRAFAAHVRTHSRTFVTARAKVTIVMGWCSWLHERGVLKRNPSEGLSATGLVASLKNTG
jgi:site-specific recombinase XerC